VCHRCGEKGHWIQGCPTNNDTNYDGRPKFRRTTGIPRSFLKVIEKPEAVGEDGKIDVSQLPAGAMYTANGEWVIAKPDEASWDKFTQKNKISAEQAKELEADQEVMRSRGLECALDHKMFTDPVKTPCCGNTYCRTCIEDKVMDSPDLLCPTCGEQCLLDDLKQDDEMFAKIKAFNEEMKAEKQKKLADDAKKTPPAGSPNHARSPSSTNSRPGSANSKKRSAEDDLENNRMPTGPAAMRKTTSKETTPAPSTAPIAPAPKNMQEFIQQMNSMSGGAMGGMQNGMPGMMNPMMMNPMMMGGMGAMPPMMPGMGMPGMGMLGGMNGGMMGNMNGGMNGYGYPQQQQGFNQFGGNGNGGGNGPPAGPKAWQQQQAQQQQWGMGGMGGMNGGMNNGGAYMRQPVNPGRHQGKQRRQRSVDYKQMGS
jgi:protein MPE1